MKNDNSPALTPKIGMEVHVFSPDKCEDKGMGQIVSVDTLLCEGEILTENYPTILLDDGSKIGGMDCWWFPVLERNDVRYGDLVRSRALTRS